MPLSDAIHSIEMGPAQPIEVEEALDGLKVRLSHPTMPTHRLVGVAVFLTAWVELLPRQELKTPFVDEALELLDPVGSTADLDGVRPELLAAAADALGQFADHMGARLWHRRLKAWSGFQFARLGSFSEICRGLNAPEEPSMDMSRDERLEWAVHLVRVHCPSLNNALIECVEFHREHLSQRASVCRFPVVPSLTHDPNNASALIRSLSCTITAWNATEDAFDLAFTHDASAPQVLASPLRAARSLLAHHAPRLLRKTFTGTFNLNDGDGHHSGTSAGLAMALLTFCEMTRFAEERRTYRLNRNCVLTGAVDRAGRVLPVDAETFAAKVDAVFFSGAELMVVPNDQSALAMTRIADLQQTYPNRSLDVRGVSTVADAWADRRIIQTYRPSLGIHLAHRFWRRKWLVALVLLSLVLGGALGIWSERRVDPMPFRWSWDENSYLVLNKDGNVLFRRPYSPDIPPLQKTVSQYSTASLLDVTSDGVPDFVWVEPRDYRSGKPGLLLVWNGTTGDIIQHDVFDVSLPYPEDISILHGRMSPRGLIVDDLDADGRPEAYVTATHTYYPGVLMKVDVLSGDVLATYHHSGTLQAFILMDLHDDGHPELILGGTNNAFDQAIIVVLDPQQIEGFGPSAGTYQPGTGPTSNELLYLRLPISEIGRFYPNSFPVIHGFRDVPLDSLIYAHDFETQLITGNGRIQEGGLLLYFDREFRLVSVGTNDAYDMAWQDAASKGLNPAALDNSFKIGFMQGVERWTPDGWVQQPISPRSKVWSILEQEAVQ